MKKAINVLKVIFLVCAACVLPFVCSEPADGHSFDEWFCVEICLLLAMTILLWLYERLDKLGNRDDEAS